MNNVYPQDVLPDFFTAFSKRQDALIIEVLLLALYLWLVYYEFFSTIFFILIETTLVFKRLLSLANQPTTKQKPLLRRLLFGAYYVIRLGLGPRTPSLKVMCSTN